MHQNLPKGVGFILLSAVSISFFNLFAKLGLEVTYFPLFIFVRFLLPFLLIIPFCLYFEKTLISKHNIHNQLIRAVVVFVMQFFVFLYLQEDTLTNTVMIWNSAPIFIPILSWLLYHHKASKVTWFATAIGFLGVVCIIKPDTGLLDLHGLYGLIAAILVGYSQVLYGINAVKQTKWQNLFFLYGFCSVLGFVVFLGGWAFAGNGPIEHSVKEIHYGKEILFFVLMAIASLLNQFSLAGAYFNARPMSLAPFIYVSIIVAGVLQFFVFNKVPEFLTVIGGVLIITAAFLKWSYRRKIQ